MDTLLYAPDSINQNEQWQLGLQPHYPSDLPNIAPLSATVDATSIEANLPPQSLLLMQDVSNLMAVITMALGQGRNTPSYVLAQTFQPLIHMAVGLQLAALQGGANGGGGGAHQLGLSAPENEYYEPSAPIETNHETFPVEKKVSKAAAGKKRKGESGKLAGRQEEVVIVCARKESGGRSYDGENARRSGKGSSYSNKNRRRGRAAWLRSPDDTPLRDGNRDRLMGLLTDRAARTLLAYSMELNPTLFGWLSNYMKEHKIPKDGSWDDVSGETFLRELLGAPMQETRWGLTAGVDRLYDCTGSILVNPRDVAQRIMDIRTQIAKEWIEEMKQVSEENALLMRETVLSSFTLEEMPTAEGGDDGGYTPRKEDEVDDSAAGSDD